VAKRLTVAFRLFSSSRRWWRRWTGSGGAGGGGAGGYRTSFPGGTKLVLEGGSYPITIGSGGAGGTSTPSVFNKGTSGNPSIFSTITSAGGGGGGTVGG
jgi:hypothetical protein